MTKGDCFTLFSRQKQRFDFPVHYHEEFELNFIEHAEGALRVAGDSREEIGPVELVLVGPNLTHAWLHHRCTSPQIQEITIQFGRDLFPDTFLKRNQSAFLRSLLDNALRGVCFSGETIRHIGPRIKHLKNRQGFDSVLELLSILHDLSTSRDMRLLSERPQAGADRAREDGWKVDKAVRFINENFDKAVRLADAAGLVGMSETMFSRFFKARTGMTFIDCLNEIRLGQASRMLIDTTNSVSEIAYGCGFTSISNFNRAFRKRKGTTPKEFREHHTQTGTRIFI